VNIFGIGLPEMALILVLALLVFGPKKLPEIGRSLAQALGSFKKAQQEFEAEFKKEADEIQESMKASIDRPTPKALSSNKQAEASSQNGSTNAEKVAEAAEENGAAENEAADPSHEAEIASISAKSEDSQAV